VLERDWDQSIRGGGKVWQDEEEEYIVRCDCGQLHFVHLLFLYNAWGNYEHMDLDIMMEPEGGTFWERIKKAFWFIVNERKFYHYGDVSLNLRTDRGRKEVEGLISFLQRVLEQAEKKREVSNNDIGNNFARKK